MRGSERTRWLRLIALAACLALVLGVAACGDDDEGGQTPAAAGGGASTEAAAEVKKVKFMLAYKDSISLLGYVIAKEKFYPGMGLEVESIPGQGGEYAAQQVIAGNAKFGLTGADSIMIAASKGVPIRGIAQVGGRGIFTVIAPQDSKVNSFQDLKGKTLGVTDLGGGEVPLVKAALADEGLKEGKDVKLLAVGEGGPAALQALRDGTVAGYAGANNDLAGMEGAGLQAKVILPEKFRELPSTHVAALQETLDNPEDREVAIKIARGYRMGSEWAVANPEEALKLACDKLPEECQDMKVAQAYFDRVVAAYNVPEGAKTSADMVPREAYDLIQTSLAAAAISEKQDLDTVFPRTYEDEVNTDTGG